MSEQNQDSSEKSTDLEKTPLNAFHREQGARMVDFAGWEMPVQYGGILEEHRAVRETAGLFDVSHMGEFTVAGPQAAAFLDSVLTNDISRIKEGRAQYNLMCYPEGGVVDDLIVYRTGPDGFLLCVNASNCEKDFVWLQQHAGDFDCSLRDDSRRYGLLALQGPKAEAILKPLTRAMLGHLPSFALEETSVAGWDVTISRTGYTGEPGFELFTPWSNTEPLARALLEAGESVGLRLAGLGARDSLRLEAGFPLYGHELSEDITPLQAGLGWAVKLRKSADFIGKDALQKEKAAGPGRRVAFFRTGQRRILRENTALMAGGREVGRVLSGTLSPMLNEAIGSALVESSALEGRTVEAELRGKSFPLQWSKPPFYTSAHKST